MSGPDIVGRGLIYRRSGPDIVGLIWLVTFQL